jgi:outer membrane biosynthesis protein TonB
MSKEKKEYVVLDRHHITSLTPKDRRLIDQLKEHFGEDFKKPIKRAKLKAIAAKLTNTQSAPSWITRNTNVRAERAHYDLTVLDSLPLAEAVEKKKKAPAEKPAKVEKPAKQEKPATPAKKKAAAKPKEKKTDKPAETPAPAAPKKVTKKPAQSTSPMAKAAAALAATPAAAEESNVVSEEKIEDIVTSIVNADEGIDD